MLDNMEPSCYRMATGYEYEESEERYKAVVDKDKNPVYGDDGEPLFVLTGKVVKKRWQAGNMAAMAFALCNRRPEQWKHVNSIKDSALRDAIVRIIDDV